MRKYIISGAAMLMSLFSQGFAGDLRIGIAKHDITDREDGINIQPQYIFDKELFWQIRPYVLGSANTNGNLNYVGAGLLRQWDFGQNWVAEFQLSLIAHDGRVDLPPPDQFVERQRILDTEITYGCEALFQEAISLGRRLSSGATVSGYFEHLSHGQILCQNGKNEGLDNIGLRIDWPL